MLVGVVTTGVAVAAVAVIAVVVVGGAHVYGCVSVHVSGQC